MPEETKAVEPVIEPATPATEAAAAIDPINPPDGSVATNAEGFVAKEQEAAAEPAKEGEADPEGETPKEGEPADPEKESEGDAKPDDKPLDTETWGDTGSDIGNSVLEVLQNSGLSTEDAKALLFDGVKAGDVSQIDAAALEAKVGKAASTIIMTGVKAFVAETAAKNEAIVADVYKAAGSQENWEVASQWAASNIPEDTLAEYRPMIDKGGAAARFAVQEIITAYNNDANNSSLATSPTPRAEPTSASPPASAATTRAQYVAALEKAHRTGAKPAEIAAIQRSRELGRQQGI